MRWEIGETELIVVGGQMSPCNVYFVLLSKKKNLDVSIKGWKEM